MDIASRSLKEFHKAIMEHGFFPEEMPPCFRVSRFYDAVIEENLFQDHLIINNAPPKKNNNASSKKQMRGSCQLARYNGTKSGGQRRVFSIPNPLFYIDVANYLGLQRSKINKFLNEHQYSCSHQLLTPSKGIKTSNFSLFKDKYQSKLAHYPFILKIDIARFYTSIYTHSIPWALHGKDTAKKDRKINSAENFGNKFDKIISNAQHGQTLGIPVGPITSRLVSEIIAIGVEKQFETNIGRIQVDAVRFVDDIYFGANNEEEANKILSYYREALAEFELEINDSKSTIKSFEFLLSESWPLRIRKNVVEFAKLPHSSNEEDFSTFLDSIMKVANNNQKDQILVYAIKVLNNPRLLQNFWEQLELFLMKVAVNFSHPFKNVAWLVAYKYSLKPQDIDIERWKGICDKIISKHAPLGHDDEVCWSCWLLKQLGGSINPNQFETIMKRCGPFSALLAVDFAYNDPDSKSFDTSLVKKRVSDNNIKNDYMIGKDWILSYEAERLFGYRFKANNRMHYKHFGKLMDRQVAFYDPNPEKNFAQSTYDDYF